MRSGWAREVEKHRRVASHEEVERHRCERVYFGCTPEAHPRTRERWSDTVKGEVERHRRDWTRERWRDTVVSGQGEEERYRRQWARERLRDLGEWAVTDCLADSVG